MPLTDDTPLVAGTYTVSVSSDVGTTVGAIVKQATNGAAQVLNVRFWVATGRDEVADEAGRANVAQIFRDRGNQIFGSANLAIGQIVFNDAPPEISRDLPLPSSGNDTTHRALCDAMEQAFPQERFLHFVIVDSVVDPESEGVTLGNAAGIPGAVLVAGTRTSCVVITGNAGGVTVAGNATTAWHEASHLFGLNHTSEANAGAFDPLPDTPECDISNDANGDGMVDQTECPDGTNFMFHDTDNTGMSEDQGNLMAAHPMFQPAAANGG